MFSQIASVFSSQGVVLPDTELVPVPGHEPRPGPVPASPGDFEAKFDQASAKLELSKQAVKAAEEAAKKKDAASGEELTPEQEKVVEKLKERDREVRRHEQSHVAAAAGHAKGGPQYEYQVGPDDRQYAVGGHVDIDVSPVAGDPQATLQKAMAVRRAATAPGEPSGADLAVASQAAQMARQAGKEAAAERAGKQEEGKAGEARRNPYSAYADASSQGRGRAETGRVVNAYA